MPQRDTRTFSNKTRTCGYAENNLDVVQYLTSSVYDIQNSFPLLAQTIRPNRFLWISWPKRSSALATDLYENLIRIIGLTCGMVDIKVIAIDDTWSGLKFVYRLKDRKYLGYTLV